MIRCLLLATALFLGLSPMARADGGEDCFARWFADARFTSRPLGDGRYLYQVTLNNHGGAGAGRYTYSFALPSEGRAAEALHGYLTPGASIDHALGSGNRNLNAQALRAATTMRCFPV